MNIEELLNKYFEGETTCEEERELRRFFTRGIVPEHLQIYRPMFGFLNEENRQSKTAVPEVPRTSVPLRRRLLYIFSGMVPEYCLYWALPVSTDISIPRPLIM